MLWILTKKKKKKKKEREVGLENLKWFNLVNKHRSGKFTYLTYQLEKNKTTYSNFDELWSNASWWICRIAWYVFIFMHYRRWRVRFPKKQA